MQADFYYKLNFTPADDKVSDEVSDRIGRLNNSAGTIIVAVDGRSASGKSTFASVLESRLDCNVFHMDDFFLTPERKTRERLSERGGNVDYEAVGDLLGKIRSGRSSSYRTYDCKSNTFTLRSFEAKKINIIEGTYSMHPALLPFYDMTILLDVSPSDQLIRLKKRCPKLIDKFIKEWLPLEEAYFNE